MHRSGIGSGFARLPRPKPPPHFLSQPWRNSRNSGCEIKSRSGLDMRLRSTLVRSYIFDSKRKYRAHETKRPLKMDAKICARKNFPIYVPALAECDKWCINVHLHKLAAWKMFHIMINRVKSWDRMARSISAHSECQYTRYWHTSTTELV